MASPHHPHAHGHPHHHGNGTAHRHTHGTVDPTLVTTQRGLWAMKWSFVGLGATALIQAMIVWMSGSVALFADTIHNVGDAATALPLWIAFRLTRRPPSPRFTYGLGRAEDLAGVIMVVLIFCSAMVVGYHQVGIHFCHFFCYEPELRRSFGVKLFLPIFSVCSTDLSAASTAFIVRSTGSKITVGEGSTGAAAAQRLRNRPLRCHSRSYFKENTHVNLVG
jgi:divalent metal cation (Fe/Co/Zn/Cd) transporter